MGYQMSENTTPREVTVEEADQHADVRALRLITRSSLQRYFMNAKTMFDPSIPLATATVQDIHLELIRRSEHNAFHGERVLADLLAHRNDSPPWQSRGGPIPTCIARKRPSVRWGQATPTGAWSRCGGIEAPERW